MPDRGAGGDMFSPPDADAVTRRPGARGRMVSPVSGAALIDLTTGTLPTGITATAASSDGMWRQTGASTVAAFTPGGALYEALDDVEAGLWSFDTYENRLALDTGTYGPSYVFAYATMDGVGGSPTRASNVANGPIGSGSDADRVGDGNNAAWLGVQFSPSIRSGGGISSSQIWLRGESGGPNGLPVANGIMQALASPVDYTITTITDTTWRRYLGRGTGTQPYCETRQTGTDSGAVSYVGDVLGWGGAAMQRGGNKPVLALLPLTDGTVTGQLPALNSTITAPMYRNGVLDVAGTFRVPYRYAQDAVPLAGKKRVFSATTGTGKTIDLWIEYDVDSRRKWRFDVNGTDLVTISDLQGERTSPGVMGGVFGSEVGWRIRHDRAQNTMLLRVEAGGAYVNDATGSATVTLDAIDTAWLGSHQGTLGEEVLDVLHTRVQPLVGKSTTLSPEGVYFADSIHSAYSGVAITPVLMSPVASMLYTYAESRQLVAGHRRGIRNFSRTGTTIDEMRADWAATSIVRGTVSWAVIAVGINDVEIGETSATILADLAAFASELKAQNGAMKVVMCLMTPAGGYLTAPQQAVYDVVQAGIEAGIANVDRVVTETYYELAAGSPAAGDYNNALRSDIELLDHLHINEAGKREIAVDVRADLTAVGALP